MSQHTTPTSGADDLRTAAQAVVGRWDTPLWKDVPATAEYIGRLRAALAAGQATAAQQGVAYAALPDEREMLKHALWLASSFTVHRYMMSCAEGRWSGAEKATCHDELCCLYVAVFRGAEVDRVRVDFEADWVAVHDATQELTDNMDVAIGFPLKGVPDYEALAPKFFAHFHRLATHAMRASHVQAPAGAGEEIDKALNVYAQAFAARVNGWTRQNGDDLPGARSALFAAIHAYAQASTRPTTSPQADSVQEDAACWHWMAEYIVGTRTDLDDEIVASETVNDLRKLVKAAIKQGASHENQNQRPHRRST